MLTEKKYIRWQKAMCFCKRAFMCHQIPERSFFFKGMQFPVCARCTGYILGFYILAPIITIFTFGNMFVSLGLIFIMFLDGFLQLKTKYKSNNILRLFTGLGAGYASFSIIVHIIVKLIEIIS